MQKYYFVKKNNNNNNEGLNYSSGERNKRRGQLKDLENQLLGLDDRI